MDGIIDEAVDADRADEENGAAYTPTLAIFEDVADVTAFATRRAQRWDCSFNYPAADVTVPTAVLANLVQTYHDLWQEYEYQQLHQGTWFHVIPASSRNAAGARTARESRLDVRVTIPDADRTVEETIDAVLAAINQSSRTRIMGNAMRVQLLVQKRVRTGARNEIARDVLMRALEATGRRVRWHLLCDATPQCALNIRVIE